MAEIEHYHADGEKELISKKMLGKLKGIGASYSWNPTDTPKLNGVSERKFKALGERCLSMILQAGLSTDFWRRAITLRTNFPRPTNRLRVYYSGRGNYWIGLRFGTSTNMGCKAYLTKPKSELRKDLRDKIFVEYFIEYNENGAIGYKMFVPNSKEILLAATCFK